MIMHSEASAAYYPGVLTEIPHILNQYRMGYTEGQKREKDKSFASAACCSQPLLVWTH